MNQSDGGTNEAGRVGDGTLDEAWERLLRSGPERDGWLTNHAPMAVEALVRHGQGARVHRWIDAYQAKLEDRPAGRDRITEENWRERLGDARYLGDWARYFGERLTERPWPEVVAEWWPRLLPGIAGGATHPVIRVGHAVRALLADGASEPRVAELAEGLGYWAARHQPLPEGIVAVPAADGPAEALASVEPVADRSGGINHRLGQLTRLPAWAGTLPDEPAQARARLGGLVRAAAGYYAGHARGGPVMLVHAVTAPNAVLRVLPALPVELWRPSVAAAWSASAAVVAAYAPDGGPELRAEPGGVEPGGADEVFARAAEHGDEHVIKLADSVLDLLGERPDDPLPAVAALRAVELIAPD
ncbi:questin oxidase family protein [Streptomyces triticirhizae]|uniref:Questin oxidase family protein n=1 Tax=Streptomyces triticirhizae TaxID=2483353 RepID=A0A3M2LZ04_9ACTN|nr:questin oxidase family protein [Streptomyces triticirhizae]RMI42507.1 questin oxidase family protein [Streptomyces triticirhizae]